MKHLLIRFFTLFLLVSFPIIAATAIGRNLGAQAILYYSFLCVLFLPYAAINNILFRKIFWLILCIFTFAWSLTETGHYIQEHAPFNELALKILYESYWQELVEYTVTTIPMWAIIIVLIGIVVAIVFIYRSKHYLYFFTKKQKWIVFSTLLIGASYYLFFANAKGDKAGFLKDEYVGNDVLKTYYKNIVIDSVQMQKTLAPFQFQKLQNGQGNTYVLIIGESTSLHHFGMYNYCRNTTPLLSKRNDISLFTDVISSNTSTVECLSRCLTMPCGSNATHDFSCPNILDIANAVGMKTFWISNQAKDGIFYNSITMATSRAKHTYFAIDDATKNKIEPKDRFDILLMPELQKALQDTAQNKLIVLHLMGTHFQYKNRYPASFNVFNSTDTTHQFFPCANSDVKLQVLNEYDNAVLYNDFLLDSIFNLLSKTPNTQSIYFSDHAEEIYDYRDFLGHTPQGGNPWLHDVPFITWNVPDSLLINKAKPYQLHRFFYTLCTWMNIGGKNMPLQESLFCKEFIEKPRTLSNGSPYTPIKK